MSRRLLNATRVTLSALIAATSLNTVGYPAAMAETTNISEIDTSQPNPQQQKRPQTAAPTHLPKTAPRATAKTDKSSTPPAPIEPFIRADAVALGQWLVLKTVRNLVDEPAASTSEPNPTPQSSSSPAQPQAATTQTQTAPPPPIASKVAIKALPPEPSSSPTIDSYTEMRVALTRQAATVTVAASEGGVMLSTNGDLIENLSAGVGYQISANSQGLVVNGTPVSTAVWLEPDSGYVAVGDRWYRGRLLLLWQNGGVMAVNYVLLQEYLYSVVGAEMSASWSLEALKAQAVAARSYAIVHTVRHQRRAYDLDDTQRYQAYKGIATEASSTQQAVHETSGEFISYGDGVVESLYAANQSIVNDAHSGYGMSQMGALDLAEQGYRYYEILATYYPDTSVGRIDVGE